MARLMTTGLALLTVARFAPASAIRQSTACTLLQVAEIESAIGGKASKQPSGEKASAPGLELDTCSVEIPSPTRSAVHVVVISIVAGLPMDGGEAIRVRNGGTVREEQWKMPGARLAQETVGKTVCILSGRPGVAGHTVCSIPRGKGYVEVDVRGSVQELASIETVRGLVQKAVTRLSP